MKTKKATVLLVAFFSCNDNARDAAYENIPYRRRVQTLSLLAEKERFELSNPVTGYTISNRAPSTN